MKQIVAIALCFLLTAAASVCCPASAAAVETSADEQEYEKEIFVLSGLEILQGFEDGSYRLDEQLTRAQFAALTLRLLGVYDAADCPEDFADVDSKHWAAGYISIAHGLRLINGYDDGNFYPDNNVTRDEAVKILVCALGYYIQAEKSGFPAGYLAVASKEGILDGIDAQGETQLTRGQAIRMLYNSLEVPVLESVYGSGDNKYITRGSTFMTLALSRLNMYYLRGKLEGAEETALSGAKLNAGKATVDGVTYNCALKDILKYIGMPVMFFVTDGSAGPEITGIMPERNKFGEVTVSGEDIISVDSTSITAESSDKKKKRFSLSANLNIIYNSFCANSTDLSAIYPSSGTIRLIDDNFDGKYETAIISSEQAFTIKSIDPDYRAVYFKDRMLMGKAFVRLDDENKDMHYKILNEQGDLINLDSLEEGMDISVAADTEFNRVKVQILSNNTFSGALSAIGSDNEIEIDGVSYRLAEDAAGVYAVSKNNLKLGVRKIWHLDKEGKVFAFDSENNDTGTYAYVLKVGRKENINKTLMLKLLIGGSYVEIEDETSTEENIEDRMIKQLQNEGIFIYETAKKISIDDFRYSSDEAAAVLSADTVIWYQTDAEGKINKIKTGLLWGDESSTERTYIKKLNLFESTGGGAFAIDKNTKILNVPKEDHSFGIYMIDSDCYVKTTLKDSAEYTAQAFDFNEDTKTAAAVVIRQDMSSEAAPEITTSTPLALVTKVIGRTNADGETVNVICGLRRGTAKEWECRSDVDISDIKKGDIVRFTEDGMERVAKIELVERLENALETYHKNAGGINEVMFGYVQSVELNTFTKYSQTMESIITLSLDGSGSGERSFSVPSRKTQPPVYVWNLETKVGHVGSFNNFRSVDMTDMQNANKALIYANSGEVQSIFIVN